jgi:hypothetical protein
MPPIVSLEVYSTHIPISLQSKYKDHLGNKLENRRYGYAAQVFAEMLSQILPGDWLDNTELETQEVRFLARFGLNIGICDSWTTHLFQYLLLSLPHCISSKSRSLWSRILCKQERKGELVENKAILSLGNTSTGRVFPSHRKIDTLPWISKGRHHTFEQGNHRFSVSSFVLLSFLLIFRLHL